MEKIYNIGYKSWIDIDEIRVYHNCEKVFIENIYHKKDELLSLAGTEQLVTKLLVENE